MNALREEIKETISATIKEKLCSDADSVTTVSHSMTALDANIQYWSDLSNKAVHRSRRALELQLKMAEEKVNTLLYEEAPEEALLEAAREARHIHFQLDQNTHLREAGLMPEQQVRFRTNTGGSVNIPSREYGVNPIHEVHIARNEADAPLRRQSTPALSMTAQLDGAVVNRMAEYSGIQQMVRQAIQNASHEAEPEKYFLAKASVKMGNPPNYSDEHNLEKFENWLRIAGARIEEVILEEDEDQIEEFDEDVPHPEEQQDWEDQPEEDDQQYHFDDDEYEMRSIDNEDVHVNAVIKDSGYNDRRRLYGIRIREAETDLRVSAVIQTGGKE
ncbi:hypothetical protein M422DRAFT_243971 [Sphaerobolus stellatus SS14]|nr:hypothetical protein M422DRAFT_243971 [Sphaerobolus stellatus SS14]